MATRKTHALTIRFSAEDAELLERLSAERDVPAAQIIREALRAFGAAHPAAPKKRGRRAQG